MKHWVECLLSLRVKLWSLNERIIICLLLLAFLLSLATSSSLVLPVTLISLLIVLMLTFIGIEIILLRPRVTLKKLRLLWKILHRSLRPIIHFKFIINDDDIIIKGFWGFGASQDTCWAANVMNVTNKL